jgi:hypothetical protein
VLKATLNRHKVEDIIDEFNVFRAGTGNMSMFGAGGMGMMGFVAGYVLYGMIMFWFGPESFEWVIGFLKTTIPFLWSYVYFA